MPDETRNEASPLVSVLTKLGDKIMENGFCASLKEITEEVRKVWEPGEEIPMTLGFWLPAMGGGQETRVDFWQPGWEREFDKQLEVVVFCRTQVRLGAVEALSVLKSWKMDDGRRVGELVMIMCQRQKFVVGSLLEVATDAQKKYLKPAVFTTNVERNNPVLNPWSTDEELCEHWGIPPDQRASLASVLAEGVVDYLRQLTDFPPHG